MKGTIGLKRDGSIGVKPPTTPKVPHRTRIKALLKVFADRWPVFADRERRMPLQIGVTAEIVAALNGEVPRRLVHEAVRWWVTGNAYLTALAEPGAMRHTLDGVPVEPVAEEHREHARKCLRATIRYK
jgi:sRNA-binding protein